MKERPEQESAAGFSFKGKTEGLCVRSPMLKDLYGRVETVLWQDVSGALQGADPDLHHETPGRCVLSFSPGFVAQDASWFLRGEERR